MYTDRADGNVGTLRDRLYAKWISALEEHPNGAFLEIASFQVFYVAVDRTLTELLEFTIYNDTHKREKIVSDATVSRFEIPADASVDSFVDSQMFNDASAYRRYRLLDKVIQARRAYQVFMENRKDVIIPILMRVVN